MLDDLKNNLNKKFGETKDNLSKKFSETKNNLNKKFNGTKNNENKKFNETNSSQNEKPETAPDRPTEGKTKTKIITKTGFFSHKLYVILFIIAFVFGWVSLFLMHRVSLKSLYSVVPDIINLIPDVLKELIQGFSFHLGFQANAFRNFLISRILFRAFLPLVYILLFSAGLRHRRGRFKREKALTISALVFTVFCLVMRVYSDYCYRMSYTVSHLSDDEIYHKLSYLLFGEQLETRGVTNYYIFVILGLVAVIVLSLVIQSKQGKGEHVSYKRYRILCIVYVVASFFLPVLNGKYFQGHVLCMSIALLSVMVFLGTSLEVKEKKKRGAAIPEDKKEIPPEATAAIETASDEASADEAPSVETAEPRVEAAEAPEEETSAEETPEPASEPSVNP